MGENQKYYFEFGEYRLDPIEHRLLRDGKIITLTPKAFETLRLLVENSGHLLEKDRLMEMLWADAFVEEGNLADNISKIRQALGDSRKAPKFIETVSGRGYRFIAGVVRVEAGTTREPSGETEIALIPPITDENQPSTGDVLAPGITDPERIAPTQFAEARKFRGWGVMGIIVGLGVGALLIYIWTTSRPRGSVSLEATKSIAVLPFKPIVAGNRDEALELGMSDTLISGLSRLRQLTVRPISSVRRYTDLEQDALAAGRELGVESVLDGNIQRSDDRIRISARLVRTIDGATLWSETFDEKFTDIFSVQDSISQKIVGALALQLSGEEQGRLTKRYTANAEAYQLYLRGRFFWRKSTPEGLLKSLEFYAQAIELDPAYALAYAGQADSYNLLGSYGTWPLKDSHPKARAAAEKALALDADLAEAHTSLAAVIADYYWDWADAEKHFKKAIDLNPNYAVARYWYSQQLSRMGHLDEAVEEARRAQALDPLSSNADAHVGLALYRARRFEDAAAELRKALEFNPQALDAHIFLGFVYIQQGKKDEAIAEFRNVVQLSGRSPSMLAHLGYAYASAGRGIETQAILNELRLGKQPVTQIEMAMIHIALGENDHAFERLDKAFEERAWQLGFLKVEPVFDPLRRDPRFTELMRKINLVDIEDYVA